MSGHLSSDQEVCHCNLGSEHEVVVLNWALIMRILVRIYSLITRKYHMYNRAFGRGCCSHSLGLYYEVYSDKLGCYHEDY